MLFGDDDDGVDLQFKTVDQYYFEDDDDEAICFSILPLQFNDNDEVPGCCFKKKVYLRGRAETTDEIHKRVLAWRIEFESEQPNISLLSEGNWIKLLKLRRSYAEKISRTTLITVQMLHFVWNHPGDTSGSLFEHLNEAFRFDFKPTMDDLRNQYSLIKLFTEKDHVLRSSMILRRFLEDGYIEIEPNSKTICPKVQFIGGDESRETNYDDVGDYDDEAYNHGYFDVDDDDDYSHQEDNSDDDASSDGHSDNDDGADPICAICDDGGKLLSCKGKCKRAFHPTKKHGRRSECETLGYTSAQRKRIATYVCENCKYKQHQCFKCGELEPSDEPNAKVFQCNNSSCGYFYHPKCIAQLLEPGSFDGACALEKKISSRMSFTCPIHWCFKCNHMEDRTQEALQLAACRRCPKSYHRQCLPREISLETKGKTMDQGATTCAWELPQIIFFYCPDHVDKATKTVRRDHIKFPPIPGIRRRRDPATKRVKMTRKRKHSMSSTKLSNRLCGEAETACAANHSKEDIQLEPCTSNVQAVEGQEKQSGTSCSFCVGRIQMSTSHVVENDMEKRMETQEQHGNSEQNDMFNSLAVERDTEEDGSNLQSGKANGTEEDGSNVQSGKANGMECKESACGHDPLSQQDGGAINLEVYSSHLCHANHKGPDVMETELNSPWYSDENRGAKISEDRSKEMTVSNTREVLVHDMGGNSDESHLWRNAQEMPTNPSPEHSMMNCSDSYPVTSYQYRYEQRCRVNCSCVDYFTCRKYKPLLDETGNLEDGGYHAVNMGPVFQCSCQGDSNTAFQPCADVRVGRDGAVYEMSSDDRFGCVPWAPAAMSIRARYVTHPEADLAWRHTYNQPRG